jgi:peptide/nickel transport system permease protein
VNSDIPSLPIAASGAAPGSAGVLLSRFRRSPGWVVLRRLLLALPLLFVVTALTFVLASLTPGDPTHEILGVNAAPEDYASLQQALGLDLPLYDQYWNWLKDAIRGDLGVSLFSGESVTHAIESRLPTTLSLMLGSLVVSLIAGVALGVFSAVRGGVAGRFVDAVSLVAFAMPSFWVGAILISVLAVDAGWFPATGYVPITESVSGWARALVLPIAALTLNGLAAIAKQTREAILDALASEYIRVARANGITEASIVFRYALKHAGIRVVTVLGLQAVGLLSATVLVENVFALPGVGGLLVDSSIKHDLPVVQGIVVYFTVIVVAINLLVDLAYTVLNPRVRTQ